MALCGVSSVGEIGRTEFNNPKAQLEAKALPSKLPDDYR